MNYAEAVKFIETFWKFGIKLGLDRIRDLLRELHDPQDNFPSIHIAGTNGKGSTCAMIASILRESGFKVGLYTSPHLIDYTERFKVNGKDISKDKFVKYCADIKKIVSAYPKKKEKPTEFEILTAVAFKYFSDEKVDIAVIETGLGGRLDSTNVIRPEVCAIINIDLDHTEILGKNINSIAKEKAGIIKEDVAVVVPSSLNKTALKVIRSVCKEKNSHLIIAPKAPGKYSKFIRLKGSFQKENAGAALGLIKELRSKGFKITDKNIKNGFRKTDWPARFQIVSKNPLVIVDAAHNPAGIKALAVEAGKKKKVTFVLGMLGYKDYCGVVKAMAPFAKRIIACAINHPKSLDPKVITKEARKLGIESFSFDELECALRYALNTASTDDKICIAGSHVTAGQALLFFNDRPR